MKWIPNFFAQLWGAFRVTLKTFIAENYLRLSASLSYYTIFSLAPLLIITISLLGYFFGKQAMEGRIFSEIRAHVGDVAAMQIQQILQDPFRNLPSDIPVTDIAKTIEIDIRQLLSEEINNGDGKANGYFIM